MLSSKLFVSVFSMLLIHSFSPGPGHWPGQNCVCLLVCMSAALAQLTDKMDPMYIIPKEASECYDEDDTHVKQIQQSWILAKLAKIPPASSTKF